MGTEKIKSRKLRNVNSQDLEKSSNRDKIKNRKLSSSSSNLVKSDKVQKRKLKGKRLNISAVDLEDKKLDNEIYREDNLSITVMILILIGCFVVGGILGYMLYRIALNGSNALLIVKSFLR